MLIDLLRSLLWKKRDIPRVLSTGNSSGLGRKEDILTKKFEEAMKKAKDAPAGKPLRDFDLD